MSISSDIKERAISLRKQGLSYSEILAQIPIAKSTLSEWLHSVQLAKHQKQRLTEKKRISQKKAAAARHTQRVDLSEKIRREARKEAKQLRTNPLWLAGTVLYWAEGSKEKPWRPSEKVVFTNMDVEALKLFKRWIMEFANVPEDMFRYELYIHQTGDLPRALTFWSGIFKIQKSDILTYFKKQNLNPHRKNIQNEDYHGVFKIRILKSTQLMRKIAGWTDGVIEYLR